MTHSKDIDLYHLASCHSRQAWVKGMTEPFPCDCGLLEAFSTAENKARKQELEWAKDYAETFLVKMIDDRIKSLEEAGDG